MITGLTALIDIGLPSGTVYMTDGGVTDFGGNRYTAKDATLGALRSIDAMTDGGEGQVPALDIGFAAGGVGAITALSNGAIQKGQVILRIAEFNPDTGAVVGTPQTNFRGFIDQPAIEATKRGLNISISAVPEQDFLFAKHDGNGQSSAFHKSLYPGETGHDNATGLVIQSAWGTEGPPTARSRGGGGGGGGAPGFQPNVRPF